jgi:hypothetical protein
VAQESQPGRTTGGLSGPVVMAENPSNHVLVDLDVERQGDLLGDSRTTPAGIPLLHFDDRPDEFGARSFRAGLPSATMERTPPGPSKRARVARKWIKRTTRVLIAES